MLWLFIDYLQNVYTFDRKILKIFVYGLLSRSMNIFGTNTI